MGAEVRESELRTCTLVAVTSRHRFLGYSVRRTVVPGVAWLPQAGVAEICSVADCMAKRPDGWEKRWDFNRACCYDSEALAMATAQGHDGFQLLAYALVEEKLDQGGNPVPAKADEIFVKGLPELPDAPVPTGFRALGYDAVCCEPSYMDFCCSPLSCNGLAAEIPVNRYCLIDDLDEALRVAHRFDLEQPEPGPYYVVQVLRPLTGEHLDEGTSHGDVRSR